MFFTYQKYGQTINTIKINEEIVIICLNIVLNVVDLFFVNLVNVYLFFVDQNYSLRIKVK